VRSGVSVLAALAVAGAASLASSATIDSFDVTRKHGFYTLDDSTFIEAAPEYIYEVLVDYEHFDRISRIYKEHGYLDPDADGTPIIFTRMEGCLLFYCKSMSRVERLETEWPDHIRTVTLPERSDFKHSTSEWWLDAEASGTRMRYRLEMEPDFWVPPIIGPWYLKRTLERGGLRAIERIERLAKRRAQEANVT